MSKNPSKQEFRDLISKWQQFEAEGNIRQRNLVAEAILKGVEGFIWKNVHTRLKFARQEDKEEAFAEVAISLISKAIPKFDLQRSKDEDLSFLTYFNWWVRSAISKYIDNSRLVKVPANKHREMLHKRAQGEELTDKELMYLPKVVYWDRTVSRGPGGGEDVPLWEVLAPIYGHVSTPEWDKVSRRNDITKKANEALQKVLTDERLIFIVKHRMQGETLQSIGDKLGVSRERIRQLNNRANDLLRRKLDCDPTILGS